MNDAIAQLLKDYGPIRGTQDEENALREVMQHLALLGLHRGGFFERASFYGGTALRILFGLDRFSEDMDFCLPAPDPTFSLSPYFQPIKDEFERYGFHVHIEEKRSGPDVTIESAFVKQGTLQGLIVLERPRRAMTKHQSVKVRLEVDKKNPPGGVVAKRLVRLPVPFMVSTLTEASLFAGKLHALVARAYLNRVKGRDYYDFLFYAARKTPINATYLEAKLRDSGHYSAVEPLTQEAFIELLQAKLATVDFNQARADVRPFLRPNKIASLDDWNAELFTALAGELTFEKSEGRETGKLR